MRSVNGPRNMSFSRNSANENLCVSGYEFLALADSDHGSPMFLPLLQYVVALLLLGNGCCEQSCQAGGQRIEGVSSTWVVLLTMPRDVQMNCAWCHFAVDDITQKHGGQFFGRVKRHFNTNAAFLPFRINIDRLRHFWLQLDVAVVSDDFSIGQAAHRRRFNPVRSRQWRVARDDPGCEEYR